MIIIESGRPFVKVSRSAKPTYAAIPIVDVISEGGLGSITVDDANITRAASSTVLTEYDLVPDLETPSSYEPSNPAIATVSQSGRVTRVANGTAQIIARSGFDRQKLSLPVSQLGGQVADTLVSWINGTVAKQATDNVETRIDGLTPSDTTLQIFSAYNHDAATYTRNPNLWCADYASALTACNAWQSNYGGGQSRAQTAITSRHIVGAAHYGTPITIGGIQRFVTADGTVINRTVTHTRKIPGADIQLSLLSSDLPETVIPVSVLPANWGDYIRNIKLQIPTLLRNQFGEARIYDVNSLTAPLYIQSSSRTTVLNTIAQYTANMPASRSAWYRPLVVGDSGGPSMMMIGGKLVILTTWTSASSGPAYQLVDWSAEIASLDALASISTAYTPDVVDLTPYTNFANPNPNAGIYALTVDGYAVTFDGTLLTL